MPPPTQMPKGSDGIMCHPGRGVMCHQQGHSRQRSAEGNLEVRGTDRGTWRVKDKQMERDGQTARHRQKTNPRDRKTKNKHTETERKAWSRGKSRQSQGGRIRQPQAKTQTS